MTPEQVKKIQTIVERIVSQKLSPKIKINEAPAKFNRSFNVDGISYNFKYINDQLLSAMKQLVQIKSSNKLKDKSMLTSIETAISNINDTIDLLSNK
jgi:hypothetical protein